MGSTVSVVFSTKRFAGGKLPLKFWNEDVWPSVEILFEKFSIEQTGGFEIFKTFASIADDDSGLVTAAQCDDYFGGHKTKYTGRIFSRSAIDMGSPENSKGMTFEEFAVAIWNYCSYSALQLARQLFEIYDCTNTGELGRPDIESMYRMMYDRDEHEVWCIDQFPFELDGHIDKLAFIKHCGQKRHLIQPAIVYQR